MDNPFYKAEWVLTNHQLFYQKDKFPADLRSGLVRRGEVAPVKCQEIEVVDWEPYAEGHGVTVKADGILYYCQGGAITVKPLPESPPVPEETDDSSV